MTTGAHMPRVLTVAGSDSSGGAGIQADIRTITTLGGYALSAITAVTAQNTLGVEGVEAISPRFVGLQISVAVADIGVDAIKSGMLASTAIANVVADQLAEIDAPYVCDPVMVSTSGARLLDDEALEVYKSRLFPRATVVTPNIPEAEALTGLTIRGLDDMRKAAAQLLAYGSKAVLLKGGHGDENDLVDLLLSVDGEVLLAAKKVETRHTHGTGCTLASAIATGLAMGMGVTESVAMAHDYVQNAIRNAPGFGKGYGPLGLGE